MLINSSTKLSLEAFLNHPAHGLAIYGPSGAGKDFLAKFIASKLLGVPTGKLNNEPNFILIDGSDTNSIGIDKVRQLRSDTKLKSVKSTTVNRVILISHAEFLTIEAQNALLKILEEPSPNSLIILTVQNRNLLLPTIPSRLQSINVRPVSLNQAKDFFVESDKNIESLWNLSGGQPGLLVSLVHENTEHELQGAIVEAKIILSQPVYERLITINQLANEPKKIDLLFEGLEKVLSATHKSTINKNDRQKTTKILASRQALYKSRRRHAVGENLKLNLLELFVSL